MSALIDTSNARANIAYVGETPWHESGQQLTKGATIQEWTTQAGLSHTVKEAKVEFFNSATGLLGKYPERKVLYRSDTGAPLSVVGDRYKVVQPGEILEFFRDLTEAGGFELETAGSLKGGQVVWALAKVGDGADVVDGDHVSPYLLLATGYGGDLATTAKFTGVRVVCWNTISMALQSYEERAAGVKRVTSVKVHHGKSFDAQAVKKELGISITAWQTFLAESRRLANKPINAKTVDELTYELVEPLLTVKPDAPLPDVRLSKPYNRILQLFNGDAIGSDVAGGPNAWAWLNAVTQLVDHERGRNSDTRMNSAWFGQGDGIKSRALDLALAA
jgi:phage/plasmid-like protein (TIGR03299 family)